MSAKNAADNLIVDTNVVELFTQEFKDELILNIGTFLANYY